LETSFLQLTQIGALVVTVVFGSTVAGVAGFGGGLIVLPIMIWIFGPKEAVPILAVTQSIAMVTRVWFNWQEVDWQLARWFWVGAIPVTTLSSLLFVIVPGDILRRMIGGLMLLLVMQAHTRFKDKLKPKLKGFIWVGAGSGFVNGFLGVGGGIIAPFFINYGVRGTSYIGTFSVIALVTQTIKLTVFGRANLLGPHVIGLGLLLGILAFVGSFLGRRLVGHLPERGFDLLVESVLGVSGLLLLIK
jgi:uncharacterized membrane protein YfcA